MSYPSCKAPQQPMDENATEEWWKENYEKNVGPLHRNKFLRIILDGGQSQTTRVQANQVLEGHIINNYTGQTSIAVRALTGKFKWILSGTPVHK